MASFWNARPAEAFWLLNFQTASTLPPAVLSFIGGTGGQFTSVGAAPQSSFTPFLAHAGLRYGLTENVDVGYRLCTVPLPFSSAGPTLGAEIDFKWRITSPSANWQTSLIGGAGYSSLLIFGQSKDAWAPGADLILTHRVSENTELSWNLRYVETMIPTAVGGVDGNNVQVIGGSTGAKIALTATLSVLPELGVFDFKGNLASTSEIGWGLQYGAVLSARIN